MFDYELEKSVALISGGMIDTLSTRLIEERQGERLRNMEETNGELDRFKVNRSSRVHVHKSRDIEVKNIDTYVVF